MPAVGQTPVVLRGMAELQRAFKLADKGLAADLREGFRSAAQPVKFDAERNAAGRIRRIGIPWSLMRVGVTTTMVYVAPNQRGVKVRGRPRARGKQFANLLRDRALDPALDANIDKVIRETEDVLNDLARAWSRV